jgi:hypothetical protein
MRRMVQTLVGWFATDQRASVVLLTSLCLVALVYVAGSFAVWRFGDWLLRHALAPRAIISISVAVVTFLLLLTLTVAVGYNVSKRMRSSNLRYAAQAGLLFWLCGACYALVAFLLLYGESKLARAAEDMVPGQLVLLVIQVLLALAGGWFALRRTAPATPIAARIRSRKN